jgi:hypothetical protein
MIVQLQNVKFSQKPYPKMFPFLFFNRQFVEVPIHHILYKEIGQSYSNPSAGELNLYFEVVIKTLNALLRKEYSHFDAHTTSTCCHGISLYVRDLIPSALEIDLNGLLGNITLAHSHLRKGDIVEAKIPWVIAELSRLYICAFIKDADQEKKRRTVTRTKKLKVFSNVSTSFCNKICHDLQKYFSNLIAARYSSFLDRIASDFVINDLPVSAWGEYVLPKYLKTDKKGVMYASCMYSMQVTLALLISNRSKITVINDYFDNNHVQIGRYIAILEGDGKHGFRKLSPDEITELDNLEEPIVVFSGCTYANVETLRTSLSTFDLWIGKFASLVLACDLHYPQFPQAADDPNFDSTPIVPTAKKHQQLLDEYKKIKGVSIHDPTLYCLTHIFPSSIYQVVASLEKTSEQGLPISFIPTNMLNVFSAH